MNALVKTLRYLGIFLLIVLVVAGPLVLVRGLQIKDGLEILLSNSSKGY